MKKIFSTTLFMLVAVLISPVFAQPPNLLSVGSVSVDSGHAYTSLLSLTGSCSVEGYLTYAGSPKLQLVFTFDQTVTSGTASVVNGVATLNGSLVFSGSTATVNLSNVPNSQYLTIAISNVNGSGKAVDIQFGYLEGDITNDGVCNQYDLGAITNLYWNQTVNASNYRADITNDGVINATDASLYQNSVRGQLPAVFAPTAITNLSGTLSTTHAGEIDITWTNPSPNNATAIVLSRSADDGATWMPIAVLPPAISTYADTNLAPGGYEYQAVAQNKAGSVADSSSTVINPILTSPTGLTGALDLDGTMTLSWTPVNGAVSYTIDRETISNGTWQPSYASGLTGTTYVDSNYGAGGYHYRISAVNSIGVASSPSVEFPQARYAVIDLGSNMVPNALSNTGYILLRGTSNGNYYRWSQGTAQALTLPYNENESTSIGQGISDNGDVAGSIEIYSPYSLTPVIWSGSSLTPTPLTTTALGPDPQDDPDVLPYEYCIDYNGTIYGDQSETNNHGSSTEQYSVYQGVSWANSGATASLLAPITVQKVVNNPPFYTQTGTTCVVLNVAKNGHTIGQIEDNVAGTGWVNTVDGIQVSFSPQSLNTDGTAIGTLGGTDVIYQNGVTQSISLPGSPPQPGLFDVNHATRIKHNSDGTTTTVVSPQIIGSSGSIIQLNPDAGLYEDLNLSDLIAPGSGFSSIQCFHINDSGAIVGTASLTTTAGTTTHGVMLLPLSIVRETTPGSGDFEPITDNGLDDNALIPIYTTESGTGLALTLSSNSLTGTFSQNLSGTSTATMAVTLKNEAGATDSGTLTETSAGSGIFTNTGTTITVTLAPTTQTTSDSTVDTLNVLASDSTLGLSSQAFTLQESAATSKSFNTVPYAVAVTLSGSLSTTSINTIGLDMTVGDFPLTTSLTETAINSRVFRDSTGLIVTITNYTSSASGSMNVAVTGSFLSGTAVTATLGETSSTSLQYSNIQRTTGNVTVSSPATDGQGVFYVQFPGSTATSISLVSGSNSVTTTASPVTGQPNLLRTGKLVLLTPGDPFSASGITTLTAAPASPGGYSKVQLQMYGQTVVDPIGPNLAFAGTFYPPADLSAHLSTVQKLLAEGTTWTASSSITVTSTGLGWTCSTPNPTVTIDDFKAAVPIHSLIYYMGFGASAVKDVAPLTGIWSWQSHGPNWNYKKIVPLDITTANTVGGQLVPHKLVFLNACLTADPTSSVPNDFATAFKADAYVGWTGAQTDSEDFFGADLFFTDLTGKDINGNVVSNSVGFAADDVSQNHVGTQYIVGTRLRVIGDRSTKVNLKKAN